MDIVSEAAALNIEIDQVSNGPGDTFAWATTPQTLLLAVVTGDRLMKQAWKNGVPIGKERSVLASMYSLLRDGAGYDTLTNEGTETVEISFFRLEAQSAPAGSASLEAGARIPVDSRHLP
ncbi:MAG TPA: hypothetical protein VFP05_13950 [Thermomicrobiales bacterium]|nr:hypothetical protein [Thermomicrobiales bacterium]